MHTRTSKKATCEYMQLRATWLSNAKQTSVSGSGASHPKSIFARLPIGDLKGLWRASTT